jgi:hypothetical protein
MSKRYAVAVTASKAVPVKDLPDGDRHRDGLLKAGWVSTGKTVCRVFVINAPNESIARSEAMHKMTYSLPDRSWQDYRYEVAEIPVDGESCIDEELSKSRVNEVGAYLLTLL